MTEQTKAVAEVKAEGGFDIAAIDTVAAANAGAEFELEHPTTGKKLGIFWTIYGKDSDVFKDYVREETRAASQRRFLAEKRGKSVEPATPEELFDKATNLLAICSIGWRTIVSEGKSEPFIIIGGEKLQFNVQNVKRVLEGYPWIRTQVDAAIGDLSVFIKA